MFKSILIGVLAAATLFVTLLPDTLASGDVVGWISSGVGAALLGTAVFLVCEAVRKTVKVTIQAKVDALRQDFSNGFEKTLTQMASIEESASNAMADLKTGVQDSLSSVTGSITEVKEAMGTNAASITGSITEVKEAMGTNAASITGSITEVKESMAGNSETMSREFNTAVQKTLSRLSSFEVSSSRALADLKTGILESVASVNRPIAEVKEAIGTNAASISASIAEVKETMGTNASSINGSIAEVKTTMESHSSSLAELKTGVLRSLSETKDNFRNLIAMEENILSQNKELMEALAKKLEQSIVSVHDNSSEIRQLQDILNGLKTVVDAQETTLSKLKDGALDEIESLNAELTEKLEDMILGLNYELPDKLEKGLDNVQQNWSSSQKEANEALAKSVKRILEDIESSFNETVSTVYESIKNLEEYGHLNKQLASEDRKLMDDLQKLLK